jgi:DNA-binding response OmpR family regulator
VRALVRRRASKLGRTLQFARVELDRHRRTASRDGNALILTAKEFSVLEFLVTRAPNVASRTEIIEHVWDSHFDSETNLVEVYINRLRQKMGEPRLIHTVHGVGYAFCAATTRGQPRRSSTRSNATASCSRSWCRPAGAATG